MTGSTTMQAREWTRKTTDSFCGTARVFVTSNGFQRPRRLGELPREDERGAAMDPVTGTIAVDKLNPPFTG